MSEEKVSIPDHPEKYMKWSSLEERLLKNMVAETTRLRQQLDIAVGALGDIQQRLAGNQYAFTSYNLAVQALAQISELEK